ncbi:MAG: hypothetical protein KatS3mg112_0333 [Thermogutta sp.]|nr:MAG: hypothetical protein KatS3mg112_0333 [Thermogutta sp.]
MWSAAIHRRFSVKALAFTTLAFTVLWHDHESAPVGAIHELPLPHRRDLFRRDVLVTSDEHRLITHPSSPGTTSVPLRNILRRDPLVRSVFFRRDVLVGSAVRRWIIRCLSAGTEVPRGKRG